MVAVVGRRGDVEMFGCDAAVLVAFEVVEVAVEPSLMY